MGRENVNVYKVTKFPIENMKKYFDIIASQIARFSEAVSARLAIIFAKISQINAVFHEAARLRV